MQRRFGFNEKWIFFIFAATLVCERTESLAVGSKGVRWVPEGRGEEVVQT